MAKLCITLGSCDKEPTRGLFCIGTMGDGIEGEMEEVMWGERVNMAILQPMHLVPVAKPSLSA